MKRTGWLLAIAGTLLAAGCSSPNPTIGNDDDEAITAADPLSMPKPMITFLKTNNWGSHHLQWHTVRQWDLLQASDQAYAKRQGWSRADVQEGTKGNGLEFLAMHRVMIRILTAQLPADAKYFTGWTTPPTNPNDAKDPVPAGGTAIFDLVKAKALDKIDNHLAEFDSDDDFGLYVETGLRPTEDDPKAGSTDKSSGVHNYIHNRFSDPSSKIDMGDPSVNLQNQRFWRLHGWIEARWTEFRSLKNLTEDDPAYQAAIMKAEAMLTPPVAARSVGLTAEAPEAPPASLTKFFERDDQ